jgi:integrase
VEEIAELRHQVAGLRVDVEELRRIAIARSTRAVSSPEIHWGVDTKTRFQGVYARHRVACPKTLDKSRRCRCRPSYYGKVWDPAIHRQRRTERRPSLREAKLLRDELFGRVAGVVPTTSSFREAKDLFIADCHAGIALNKRGAPYRPKAVRNLDSSLNSLPESIARKPFCDVAGWDLQLAIDECRRRGLSSSRIHSIICAVRSLYTWGMQRGKALEGPARSLRLPAVRSQERSRVARPGEFASLLQPLAPQDALPWALAAYGTARLQEIQVLGWADVDFAADAIVLAEDERGRKSESSWRLVPMVDQLQGRLLREWIRQGEPQEGQVCPPRNRSKSALLSLDQLSKRIKTTWRALGLEPIGLQDSRHTAATWLDHAGVSPRVASALMGHRVPSANLRVGAAPLTLRCYTHVLDGELERGRDLLNAFLAVREAEEGEDP